MRIIGGTYRGKKLFSPLNDNIRPTADKARQALFNILDTNYINDWNKVFLADIFSGTGAFAFEAVSRGAKGVVLVDIDIKTSAKNALLFPNEKNKIRLIKSDVSKIPAPRQTFAVIFCDAPYHQGLSEKAIAAVLNKKWLADDGVLIVETASDEKLLIPDELQLIEERRYGIAAFHFLQHKKTQNTSSLAKAEIV
ncbi:MAG: 16S rRNA (guanine(966)-N(2))-methyltransferase RsmD [Alphaproteobacteria bacterium]|nr:16S rRNA (guanine(966)-N(2))-methyltransferase RsmD [Alphaproteobacteria bacterium]